MREALDFLGCIGQIKRVSSLYSTSPVGMPAGTGMFLNQAVILDSPEEPGDLLIKVKEFERRMGRDPENSHYTDRTIDIDILMAGNLIINSKRLTIPHPEMTRRAFVLVPLVEIAPDLSHPIFGKSLSLLLFELSSSERIKKAGL